ncbi:DUF4091 domain-containing protein [Sporofaciens sp. SGI.106]|uniref:DUF4091 domain-containing protein n=1 Tax=Sporofaciens sp. SGI.106 TaxID=3420568 RepID=UPI003D084473
MWKKKEIKYEMKLLSSLAKVFQDETPVYRPECLGLSALWGETVSFQAAYTGDFFMRERLDVKVVSPIADHVRVRSVEQVPVGRATNGIVDDNYLRTTSGLYPDLLKDIPDGKVIVCSNQWRSLWVDVEVSEDIPAGRYEIEIQLVKEEKVVCSSVMKLMVVGTVLPQLDIMHTEWMHADCLADYYHVEVFSEEHWQILENYFHEYVSRDCNMMLVPLFTSPLDTAVGLERTTTQLVEVEVKDGEYFFGFDKVKRWIDLCKSCGIRYFEMSHLFSQWGAKYAPKVVAMVNGKEEKIFGWHTPAVGEYTRFLESFLPQLIEKLREWEIADVTYFHISDEPREEHLETYRAAKESLGHMLDGFHTFDALSSYEFYKHGLVDKPIPGNNEIEEFLEHGLTDMWTYYCTGQFYEVSNRFMSMPSARNRIYGVQLYKYNIIGILHWGYNFYNSQFSIEHINPYEVTDAGNAFPSGDPFLVYPGKDGHPEESIRMMVHYEAMTDLRALKLLESLTSREHVMELIEGELAEPLTFKRYPKSDMYLITLRNRVNREISEIVSRKEA